MFIEIKGSKESVNLKKESRRDEIGGNIVGNLYIGSTTGYHGGRT